MPRGGPQQWAELGERAVLLSEVPSTARDGRVATENGSMKRFLKIVGILTLFAIGLAYFVFRLLFFDPFEGDYGSLDPLVPRNADFMVRRAEMSKDFNPFPMPDFFLALRLKREWKEFERTQLYQEWADRLQIGAGFEEVQAQVEQAKPLDPLLDLLGREVMAVGRYEADGSLGMALLARGSFRVKAAVSALSIGPLRGLFGEMVSQYQEDQGVETVTLSSGETFHLFRDRDLVVGGNSLELVRDIRRRAEGEGASITDAAQYRSILSEANDVGRPVDFACHLDQLGQRFLWGSQGDNTGVALGIVGELLPLESFGTTAGRLCLGNELELRLRSAVDYDALTSKGAGLFNGSSASLKEMYRFCGRVFPTGSLACGYYRLNLKPFLMRLESLFGQEERSLLNDFLREVRRNDTRFPASTVAELMAYFSSMVADEIAWALEPQAPYTQPDSDEVKFPDKAWGPRVAFAFPVADRAGIESLCKTLIDSIRGGRERLGRVFSWTFRDGNKFQEVEFLDPTIPPIALGIIDLEGRDFFVLTTTGQFLQQIYEVRLNLDVGAEVGVGTNRNFKRVDRMLDGFGQGFAFADSNGVRQVMEDLAEVMAEDESRPDWITVREQVTRQLLADHFPQQSRGPIPDDIRRRLELLVDQEMDRNQLEWVQNTLPAAIEERRKNLAIWDLFRWAAATLTVHERDVELRLRVASPAVFP
jgi:hypothetical protein